MTIASVQTACRPDRLADVVSAGPYDLVVQDECHHSPAGSFKKIREALDAAGQPFHLGLTATPHRTDGAALSAFFGDSPVRKFRRFTTYRGESHLLH